MTLSRLKSWAATAPCVDHLAQETDERHPVRRADQDDRKAGDLACLNQRQRLGQLVERAEPAGQHDERVRVLEQQHLAHEEVVAGDEAIEVRVRRLLERQLDVAADRSAAGVARAAIGGLHQARAAAGHHGEAERAHAAADFARDLVERMRLAESRRSEDRDARPDEVQRAESADEVAHRAREQLDLAQPRVRSFEKRAIVGAGFGLTRRGRRRRGRLRRSHGMRGAARSRGIGRRLRERDVRRLGDAGRVGGGRGPGLARRGGSGRRARRLRRRHS